mmetsp:Transcript_39652/g.126717  ORF Transcript_39652/g.126717 Transcript_39652/m.126717 type:complete len:81 (+) Transcript_39652:137-379(+)
MQDAVDSLAAARQTLAVKEAALVRAQAGETKARDELKVAQELWRRGADGAQKMEMEARQVMAHGQRLLDLAMSSQQPNAG